MDENGIFKDTHTSFCKLAASLCAGPHTNAYTKVEMGVGKVEVGLVGYADGKWVDPDVTNISWQSFLPTNSISSV